MTEAAETVHPSPTEPEVFSRRGFSETKERCYRTPAVRLDGAGHILALAVQLLGLVRGPRSDTCVTQQSLTSRRTTGPLSRGMVQLTCTRFRWVEVRGQRSETPS